MSDIALYYNSHIDQDLSLIKEFDQLDANKTIFFNTRLIRCWQNACSMHAKQLYVYTGIVICTCPITHNFLKNIKAPQKKVFLWNSETIKKYKAIENIRVAFEVPHVFYKAETSAPPFGNVKPISSLTEIL